MTTAYRIPAFALALAAASFGAGRASEPGQEDQIKAGRDVALIVCSACHVVARDQPYPVALKQPVPAFEDIANRPEMNAQALQQFLSGTHWDMRTVPMKMPDLMLMDNQKRNVTAYIMSLKKK